MRKQVYYVGNGLVDAESLLSGSIILCPLAIARALSLTYRFRGQTRVPFDVARHSIMVSALAGELARGRTVPAGVDQREAQHAARVWGLLHDATEAIMADVPSPIKSLSRMGQYRLAESTLGSRYWRHHLPAVPDCGPTADFVRAAVEDADRYQLAFEAQYLLPWEGYTNVIDAVAASLSPAQSVELSQVLCPGTELGGAHFCLWNLMLSWTAHGVRESFAEQLEKHE